MASNICQFPYVGTIFDTLKTSAIKIDNPEFILDSSGRHYLEGRYADVARTYNISGKYPNLIHSDMPHSRDATLRQYAEKQGARLNIAEAGAADESSDERMIMSNTEKEIDPETKEAIKKMKRGGLDAQACPGCNRIIIRDSGCRHMWCPGCGAKFDHTTRERITGFFHNPEYFDHLNRQQARQRENPLQRITVATNIDEFMMNILSFVKPKTLPENMYYSQPTEYAMAKFMNSRATCAKSAFAGLVGLHRAELQNDQRTIGEAIILITEMLEIIETFKHAYYAIKIPRALRTLIDTLKTSPRYDERLSALDSLRNAKGQAMLNGIVREFRI